VSVLNNEKQVIKLDSVCKQHGNKDILSKVTFEAKSGRVTAFLGPNGAGKSSTLRILLGLDYPRSGAATFGGEKYIQLKAPLRVVGAVFDGLGGTPSRRIRTHLYMIARSNDIPVSRVPEVLQLVGMSDKSRARLGTLSLGEGQRLGLAAALLGDPQYLVLDEPVNGLDPGGIRWFRQFIREQAKLGKTVLLSSHFLSEVESVADDIVIIDHGRIVTAGSLEAVVQRIESLEDLFFAVTNG
jgi:ABC-2 type transport system ATP-binding protein